MQERFWAKVNKTDSCWLWTAGTNGKGYGFFTIAGIGTRRAHRLAYEWLVGPIPEGYELDHLCRVTLCVNPAHLEPVTHLENMRRGFGVNRVNRLKENCPRGHPYEGENLRMDHGRRRCRKCERDKMHAKRDEMRPDRKRRPSRRQLPE